MKKCSKFEEFWFWWEIEVAVSLQLAAKFTFFLIMSDLTPNGLNNVLSKTDVSNIVVQVVFEESF